MRLKSWWDTIREKRFFDESGKYFFAIVTLSYVWKCRRLLQTELMKSGMHCGSCQLKTITLPSARWLLR